LPTLCEGKRKKETVTLTNSGSRKKEEHGVVGVLGKRSLVKLGEKVADW